MIRVLLLCRYSHLGASSRLRAYQYLPYLKTHGFEITEAPLFGDDYVKGLYQADIPLLAVLRAYINRLGAVLRAHKFDLVWVEYEMLPWVPAWFECGLFPSRVPLVVDYDDAIFHRYDLHPSRIVRRLLGAKIDAVMGRANLVLVGNEYLGERARHAGAKRIELMPTVVDTSRYTVARPPLHRPITIGWIGSPVTDRYLHLVAPPLRQVASSRDMKVVAVGANGAHLAGLAIETRPWSEATEVAEIQQFDIGIMPLSDGPWERGKCGYKLIQYMACGKPVVASPVGVNAVLVRHGINGFLARDEREWIQALELLCDDHSLRQRMGLMGRERVEQAYSLEAMAPKLEKILRSVVRH